MIYVGYEDKGPSGPCGQTVSNTAPWRKLYVFNSRESFQNFMDSIHSIRRIQPKIVGVWDSEFDDVVFEKE